MERSEAAIGDEWLEADDVELMEGYEVWYGQHSQPDGMPGTSSGMLNKYEFYTINPIN